VIIRSPSQASSYPGGSQTQSGGDYIYTFLSPGNITY
jgi:hypothetical protein